MDCNALDCSATCRLTHRTQYFTGAAVTSKMQTAPATPPNCSLQFAHSLSIVLDTPALVYEGPSANMS